MGFPVLFPKPEFSVAEWTRRRRGPSRRDALRLGIAAVCGAAMLRMPAGWGQAPTPPGPLPQFDVTSVKPSRSDSGWQGIETMPGRIRADSVTVNRCIREAYGVGPHQVIGGPDWIANDRWEIVARADRPVDDDDVLMLMLRQLLADRFQLALHRETRMLPSYVLEVGKSGPRMQRADAGESNTEMHGGRGGPATLQARKTDMNRLAEVLEWRMDRPVVNHTGLTGAFNFTLHWAPDSLRNPDDGADDVSIFTAVGEQLGLRMRVKKAAVEVLAIDHVERPAPN